MLVGKEATAGLERRSQPVSKNKGRRELFLRKLVQNEMRPGILNEILYIWMRLNNPARRAQDEKVKNENVSAIYCVSRLLYT